MYFLAGNTASILDEVENLSKNNTDSNEKIQASGDVNSVDKHFQSTFEKKSDSVGEADDSVCSYLI